MNDFIKKTKFLLAYNPIVRVIAFPYIQFQYQLRKKKYSELRLGERIEDFKNLHSGEKCFIVANGPSLRVRDLDILFEHKVPCFGMNSIFDLFEQTKWRPNYYFVYDRHYINSQYEEVIKLPLENIFIAYSKMGKRKIIRQENIFYYFTDYVYAVKPETAKKRYVRSDLDKMTSFAISTTQICIEFAMYMGFREIFLLGVDHNYSSGMNSHAKGIRPAAYYVNHWSPGIEQSTNDYRMYEDYSKSNGVKIYNATRGGELEVFERVDFDSIWDKSDK